MYPYYFRDFRYVVHRSQSDFQYQEGFHQWTGGSEGMFSHQHPPPAPVPTQHSNPLNNLHPTAVTHGVGMTQPGPVMNHLPQGNSTHHYSTASFLTAGLPPLGGLSSDTIPRRPSPPPPPVSHAQPALLHPPPPPAHSGNPSTSAGSVNPLASTSGTLDGKGTRKRKRRSESYQRRTIADQQRADYYSAIKEEESGEDGDEEEDELHEDDEDDEEEEEGASDTEGAGRLHIDTKTEGTVPQLAPAASVPPVHPSTTSAQLAGGGAAQLGGGPAAKRRVRSGSAGGGKSLITKCRFCPKRFASQVELAEHTTYCLTSRPHGCEECGKRFKTRAGLDQHTRIHNQTRQYKCNFCDKSFIQKCHLDQHERIHTGEKPYACGICGRAFRQRSGQQQHELTHLK